MKAKKQFTLQQRKAFGENLPVVIRSVVLQSAVYTMKKRTLKLRP